VWYTAWRMSREVPKITEVHNTFHRRLGAIAHDMTHIFMQTIQLQLGEYPPSGATEMRHRAAFRTDFCSENKNKSKNRALETPPQVGSIAGSDFITFSDITMPVELWGQGAYDNVAAPSRIVDLALGYNAAGNKVHETSYYLYCGSGTPPMMVDRNASMTQNATLDPHEIKSLSLYMARLPENAIYAPDATELQTVLGGVQRIYDYIDVRTPLQEIKDEVDESIEAGESMHTKETAEWFTGRVQYMRDAGIYSLGELRAAPPFPG